VAVETVEGNQADEAVEPDETVDANETVEPNGTNGTNGADELTRRTRQNEANEAERGGQRSSGWGLEAPRTLDRSACIEAAGERWRYSVPKGSRGAEPR
jgi:hypothetical protein